MKLLRWIHVHWLLFAIPILGIAAWSFYLWKLARADVAAPDLPFIYDL